MYKYEGKGNFIPDIPARDLEDSELSKEQKNIVENSGIYTRVKDNEDNHQKEGK